MPSATSAGSSVERATSLDETRRRIHRKDQRGSVDSPSMLTVNAWIGLVRDQLDEPPYAGAFTGLGYPAIATYPLVRTSLTAWSGRRESNSRYQLGKLKFCH